jgi:hypothetical protein
VEHDDRIIDVIIRKNTILFIYLIPPKIFVSNLDANVFKDKAKAQEGGKDKGKAKAKGRTRFSIPYPKPSPIAFP